MQHFCLLPFWPPSQLRCFGGPSRRSSPTFVRAEADALRSYSVLILALDTTTRDGSVAVSRSDTVMAVVHGDGSRTHGERLPGEIERALTIAGIASRNLDLLAVASGPGAFTGLRIGLAAIQGLAMVLGVPVVGVSALDALACATWPGLDASHDPRLVAWMDAQRDEVFSADYATGTDARDFPWRQREPPVVGTPQSILARLEHVRRSPLVFVGNGAQKYGAELETWSEGRAVVLHPPQALAPFIAFVGQRQAARGLAASPHALQPLYVRRPDAELERLRRSAP